MTKRTLTCLLLVLIIATMLTGCVVASDVTLSFDTKGGSQIEDAVYKVGAVTTKPDNPTREGYEFAGWYVDEACTRPYIFSVMGDTDTTIYAKWTQISFNITFIGNGGAGSTIMVYDGNSDVTLPQDWTREGYKFAGWYENEDFTSNAIETIPKGSTGDKTFYAKWIEAIPDTYVVTLNGNGGIGSALDSYRRGEAVVLPSDWTQTGYTFGGWYEDKECLGAVVTTILASDTGDKTYYARWIPIEYTITFDTNGGSHIDALILPYGGEIVFGEAETPVFDAKIFDGWYTDVTLTEKFTAKTMPAMDITLYAKWVDGYNVQYIFDDNNTYSFVAEKETITLVDPLTTKYNRPDYFFDGWYLEPTFVHKCGKTLAIDKNTNIYAKWTHRSFLPYIDRFRGGGTPSAPIGIDNTRELVALVDYAMFTGRDNTYFSLKYTNSKTQSDNAIREAIGNLSTNNIIGTVQYGTASNNSYSELTIPSENIRDNYIREPHQVTVPKMLNALVPVVPKSRTAVFDDFAYKTYEETLNVTTSNQLFYALQYGIKPIVKSGSSAERMLSAAKDVLREICDDSMTDFEKLYAIFCWVNQNVTYDNAAAKNAETNPDYNPNQYKSWHLEGVFEDGFAVCDGIAKSVTVLARIEGVPCLRVTGIGHAWNKVYIDLDKNGVKEWFNLDATWGNASIGDGKGGGQYDTNHILGEAIDNEQFLFHDDYIISGKKRIADNHKDIKATTLGIASFEQMKYKAGGKEADLVIEANELQPLAQHVHEFVNKHHLAKGSYVVVNVRQSVVAGTENFVSKFGDALTKENIKSFTDTDTGGLSYMEGAQYSARILVRV